jgi:hypothetical protein
MSVIDDIAAAVVTEMNGAPSGTFNQTFTAQQFYVPLFDLEDLSALHVSIVPKGRIEEASQRNATMNEYSVDVAIQQKVPDWTDTSIGPLLNLAEQIGDFLRLKRLPGPNAMWARTEHRSLYSAAQLKENSLFVSVMTFTFKVVR